MFDADFAFWCRWCSATNVGLPALPPWEDRTWIGENAVSLGDHYWLVFAFASSEDLIARLCGDLGQLVSLPGGPIFFRSPRGPLGSCESDDFDTVFSPPRAAR